MTSTSWSVWPGFASPNKTIALRGKHQRRYVPDFLVEYEDGRQAVIEVKDPSRIESDDVKRKRKAAEMWCKQRHMEYMLATVG